MRKTSEFQIGENLLNMRRRRASWTMLASGALELAGRSLGSGGSSSECAQTDGQYAPPLVPIKTLKAAPQDSMPLKNTVTTNTTHRKLLSNAINLSSLVYYQRRTSTLITVIFLILLSSHHASITASTTTTTYTATDSGDNSMPTSMPVPAASDTNSQSSSTSCFGGLQTFEKISMSSFENPGGTSGSLAGGILIQQDDQALTSECVNLCKSQSNCLSFVIDYNKFECKSYATTQQELQQELDAKYQAARSISNSTINNGSEPNGGYQTSASTINFQQLLPSASSNYFEKICLDGVANRNQFADVCGAGRLWTIERVVDSFLDGFVEKEVTNVNNKDECSKLCISEGQFVCRSADYDQRSRLCRLSKEDRRTQPQAMRYVPGSERQYLENQCATPGPSSCVYETKKNVGIISMDALKFAQTIQDCQMKCNQESTFNCRSYSFHQQRCFLSGDDSSSLNSNLIRLPMKQGWQFGEKKCLVELCTKGVFTYEKITGYSLRSALSTPIDLMMPAGSSFRVAFMGNNLDDLERLQNESSQTRLQQLLPMFNQRTPSRGTSNLVSTMMMMAANSNPLIPPDPMHESASTLRRQRSSNNNLAITNHCRHSCDLGYLNCPAFTIDYKNNRCQRLDRNSQGRHHELVARDGYSYYEKICLRVPEIMSMCQDKYWIFERVIGYELGARYYEKTLKFVQSRRDCEEYCLEEKQFQCRSAVYNDEVSECKLSRYNRRLVNAEGGYYRNFNVRISYLENQCIRDHEFEKQCTYEQAKEEPAYPTYTEHIEMVSPSTNRPVSDLETEGNRGNLTNRVGATYCQQLCNDNAKFECHSFGYYASTAQCFLSGDDFISAGELATTPSTGFIYYEKKCKPPLGSTNYTLLEDDNFNRGSQGSGPYQNEPAPPVTVEPLNPYFQPTRKPSTNNTNSPSSFELNMSKPTVSNNNISIHIDHQLNMYHQKHRPSTEPTNDTAASIEPNHYKCGVGHTFVYQRISGFEPIGGFLTLLIRNNEQPGIVAECSELCKRAYECRAFVVDYNSNQCYAMLENSSVCLLSLRQTLGKDYFEGFCVADHILLTGNSCRNKTWVVDKIVDQAVLGVQYQKVIPDADRAQCRQACLEERLFWCKSAMFDGTTGDCKLYSIDRESMPQMRLLFTKGVDFYENQCQITSNYCPYDAIERDITIVTVTKSVQARSTFDCEHSCNHETSFNCRSYTYTEQYSGLPNLCILSSDSRSTSQRGSVRDQQHTLYAERNCYFRRPRYPGGGSSNTPKLDPYYQPASPAIGDAYQPPESMQSHSGHSTHESYAPPKLSEPNTSPPTNVDIGPALGSGCEPHQYTFERTFGFDYRLGQKERAPISPALGMSISCQQECLRRGDRCQSFVVEYALPYQSCFLIDTQVGANKKLLVKAPNTVYYEKVCLPRTGLDVEQLTQTPVLSGNQVDPQPMDIAPSYSSEPWTPQAAPIQQAPHYLQQMQQLVQNYPSRSCTKLWSFERFINYNFTAPTDRMLDKILTRAQCETHCLNEASFSCRAATYDYSNKLCRLFKNTRRTTMSQFVDLESSTGQPHFSQPSTTTILPNAQPGTAHVLVAGESETLQSAQSTVSSGLVNRANELMRRQGTARQLIAATGEASMSSKNIDYLENTCVPEPSSCQYRQLYDLFSPYIDKINHATSLNDCQRQCDLERLFSCKSINYDPSSKNCMLINEDLISLNRGQQASLLPKKNSIYSEKGNCELISVQCNSQEMLVSINFDSPFRGRVMAKGNPEQCFLIGDGQTNIQFPIVFGPKCNSRQEGHNTFVNEVVIQQHPVIMTESDKTVRVMCAFEAPEQTITLKNPSSRDNKTGIDVGTPEMSRTRHDKQHLNPIVSNKASPPSVVLRILDQSGRDPSMINLGDDLILKIQLQVDGQNSALGIFARNLAARSSNGESLLLIDNDGCPVDRQVFPALEVDPKDGRSLYSTFKAFRFPSSGLVNFEVQIKFCPERCQPVDCQRGGQKLKSFGRKKRAALEEDNLSSGRTSFLQSSSSNLETGKNPLDSLSTVMKPGKAFQFVRELLLAPQNSAKTETPAPVFYPSSPAAASVAENSSNPNIETSEQLITPSSSKEPMNNLITTTMPEVQDDFINQQFQSELELPTTNLQGNDEFELKGNQSDHSNRKGESEPMLPDSFQKSILMHVDEKVVPNTNYINQTPPRALNQPYGQAPYGRYPTSNVDLHIKHQSFLPNLELPIVTPRVTPIVDTDKQAVSNKLESSTPATSFFTEETNQTNLQSTEGSLPRVETYTVPTSISDDEARLEKVYEQEIKTPEIAATGKEMPLRFSILVGENQAPNSKGWVPNSPTPPVLVMNSSNENLDHIVIPGRGGQLDHSPPSTNQIDTLQTSSNSYNDNNLQPPYGEPNSNNNPRGDINNSKRNSVYEQTFDALPSNSIAAEVKINRPQEDKVHRNRPSDSGQSETAASHVCREPGSSKLWTIIWTGTFVIALNICLVVVSLLLYFRKIRLRQNHDIMRANSECGTHSSSSGNRWPSVLLKSKNNLGSTSLNTHEHFFCRLNSEPSGSTGLGGRGELNWPNLSSSSSHSTISSLASPFPVTSIRINQTRQKSMFDCDSSNNI